MEGSMMTTPTPEEAQRALHDIADVKEQTVAAAASPRWWYLACGAVAAGLGVLSDLAPGFFGRWSNLFVWVVLLVIVARANRWGAPLFGRRVSPRLRGNLATRLGLGVIGAIAVFVVVIAAMWLHVPHLTLWTGIGGGLLIALAGPWWQRRMLRRGARL
jgi:hypothetical protein